ncbi:phage tail tape measure protein [Chitiniphilus shinanonensis]|uniref:phage tail tape measure protein n=1 Tax=Chitiniphilus shinanonensis TaxID=553088 RepID=UPI003341D7AF
MNDTIAFTLSVDGKQVPVVLRPGPGGNPRPEAATPVSLDKASVEAILKQVRDFWRQLNTAEVTAGRKGVTDTTLKALTAALEARLKGEKADFRQPLEQGLRDLGKVYLQGAREVGQLYLKQLVASGENGARSPWLREDIEQLSGLLAKPAAALMPEGRTDAQQTLFAALNQRSQEQVLSIVNQTVDGLVGALGQVIATGKADFEQPLRKGLRDLGKYYANQLAQAAVAQLITRDNWLGQLASKWGLPFLEKRAKPPAAEAAAKADAPVADAVAQVAGALPAAQAAVARKAADGAGQDAAAPVAGAAEQTTDALDTYLAGMRDQVAASLQSMEAALVGFAVTGELSFRDMVSAVGQDLGRLAIRQVMNTVGENAMGWLSSLGSWIGGLFAQGGAFSGNQPYAFADGGAFTNRLVSQPTPFRFATGGGFRLGVMGEAGPEAVMPLARDSQGRLGVHLAGGVAAGAGQGASVNLSMSVHYHEAEGRGDHKAEGGADIARQLGARMEAAAYDVITREKRPGGLLYAG